MKKIKSFIFNLILISTLSTIFSGCVASINYNFFKMHGQSDGSLLYKHKAINGDDLYSAITTVKTYEFYLDLSKNKALSYTINNGILYLAISEGQKDIKTAKENSLKICKKFSSKECNIHSVNNKMVGAMK